MLSKEQILSAQDLKTQVEEVPEWGGSVILQQMDAATYERMHKIADCDNKFASILVNTIVDEQGNSVFDQDDIEALGHKNFDVLDRLADIVLELSNLDEYVGRELEKNSEETPSA